MQQGAPRQPPNTRMVQRTMHAHNVPRCTVTQSHGHTVTTDKMEFDMLKQHMIAACFVNCFARCLNLNDPVCRSMHIGVLLGLDHQRLYR